MTTEGKATRQSMDEWVSLGGGNSGIIGNKDHKYGYHRGANEVPSTDYSRYRDPEGSDGPYPDWNAATAGDFYHGGNSRLRAYHARLLKDLTEGKHPMICEFIGQPDANGPVIYWARWNGKKTIRRYTGSGHKLWSHVSHYRSMSDQYADLWGVGGVAFMLVKEGDKGDDVELVQRLLIQFDYSIGVYPKGHAKAGDHMIDGIYGPKMKSAVAKFRVDRGIKPENKAGNRITPWTAKELLIRAGEEGAQRVIARLDLPGGTSGGVSPSEARSVAVSVVRAALDAARGAV